MTGNRADRPPFTFQGFMQAPAGQRPQVERGPLRVLNRSPRPDGIVMVGGYLGPTTWFRAEVHRPPGTARWGRASVIRRFDGSYRWTGPGSKVWWAVMGRNSWWEAGITEDGEWNICAANGDLDDPYLSVNELATVPERRRRGLAAGLLNRLRDEIGLQPIPEIVRIDEPEGLAIPFWRHYLSTELVDLIERLSNQRWGNVVELLRQFRRAHRRRHDRIVFEGPARKVV